MSSRAPRVTVYVTNYNYGRYVEQAISSVLKQTFTDLELIIIDDGSEDDSRDILQQYEGRENTFVIFQQNRGLNVSNNIALRVARGEYLIRLDADDFLDPRAVEILVAEMDRHPEVALIFPDYYHVDEHGAIREHVRRHEFEQVTLKDQPAHGACTMIRRKVLLEVGGYDEAFSRQDGYDLWLKLLNRYPVKNVNLPLFYYRRHSLNLTGDEERLLRTRAQLMAKHASPEASPRTVLGVIPVRGEASDPRSIPLARLGDRKRLIDWTIEAALEAERLDGVVVTSPDEGVLDHVKKTYGSRVETHFRPIDLARINSGVEPTLLQVMRDTGHRPDALLALYVEAPFRSSWYIDKTVDTMRVYGVDAVDSVRRDDSFMYVHNGGGLEAWSPANELRLERNQLYRRCGGLYLIDRRYLETKGTMVSARIGHVLLDQKAGFTITTQFDLELAQLIAERPTVLERDDAALD